MDFSRRSYQKEFLDEDHIPFEDIRLNMEELNTINTYLGGHRITLRGIQALLKNDHSNGTNNSLKAPLFICEIGCGGGDNLNAIDRWCTKKNIATKLLGIDIRKECIDHAIRQAKGRNFRWIVSDYKNVDFGQKIPDIIFSSLFCHHFNESELVGMMQWMQRNSRKGFFINDLHRHRLAYYSIKTLSSIFSKSYLVKNDAPISVLRGFRKNEWQKILDEAGIYPYQIKWKWAFRWLISAGRQI